MTRRSLCDLFLPLASLRCYRGNRSKGLALVDSVITSSSSLVFISTTAAVLSVKHFLFVCESSFNVSGVLPVTSFPLFIGENSIVFVSCSFAFGIGVVSVVFLPTSSMLCSGVSRSTSVMGKLLCLVSFSSVVYSLLFLVLTILTETFFFIILDFVVDSVCLCCLDG